MAFRAAFLLAFQCSGRVRFQQILRAASLLVEELRLGNALAIVIFMISYMGFTVDFWGITWILVGLLVGVRAHIGELGRIDNGAAGKI